MNANGKSLTQKHAKMKIDYIRYLISFVIVRFFFSKNMSVWTFLNQQNYRFKTFHPEYLASQDSPSSLIYSSAETWHTSNKECSLVDISPEGAQKHLQHTMTFHSKRDPLLESPPYELGRQPLASPILTHSLSLTSHIEPITKPS